LSSVIQSGYSPDGVDKKDRFKRTPMMSTENTNRGRGREKKVGLVIALSPKTPKHIVGGW
jgi:hypothetical protein